MQVVTPVRSVPARSTNSRRLVCCHAPTLPVAAILIALSRPVSAPPPPFPSDNRPHEHHAHRLPRHSQLDIPTQTHGSSLTSSVVAHHCHIAFERGGSCRVAK